MRLYGSISRPPIDSDHFSRTSELGDEQGAPSDVEPELEYVLGPELMDQLRMALQQRPGLEDQELLIPEVAARFFGEGISRQNPKRRLTHDEGLFVLPGQRHQAASGERP